MITRQQLTEAGRTIKPHGINGEIAAAIMPILDLDTARCLVLDIDGIYVPFFVNTWRRRGSEAVLLSLDGISNEAQAKALCGKAVYALTDDIIHPDDPEANGLYADDLKGFTIIDPAGHTIGSIEAIDTSTANTLFVVTRTDSRTAYIPIAEEFITAIDPQGHTITMDLPEGLLNL